MPVANCPFTNQRKPIIIITEKKKGGNGMNAGDVIAQLRHERGYSQEKLASLLFVSKDLVSKWENGSRRPDYLMIERIAEVFGVAPDRILEKERFIFEELSDCIPDGIQIPESEFAELLNAFLRTITTDEKEIFISRYFLMESFASISERRGIRENHIRSLLSRTRKKLKKMIRRRFYG